MKLQDCLLYFGDGDWIESKDQSESGIRLIQTGNIGVNRFIPKSDKAKFVSLDTFDRLKCFEIFPGDILVSRLPDPVGRACILPDIGQRAITAVDCSILRPDESKIDKSYLIHFLNSPSYFKRISGNTSGATRQRISRKNLGSVRLTNLPNLAKQKEIANELDLLSNAIGLKEKGLDSLDSLVKSRFMEMFPDWDLSSQKPEWTKLKILARIYTGTTPKTEQKEFWDGDIPWVTPAELNDDSYIVKDTERHITEAGMLSKSLSLMPAGTVLLSTRAPIGKVAICGVPMTCNQGFKNFGCGKDLNPTFLYILLKLNVEWLQSQGTGTTFKEISKSKAEEIKIFVPDIAKQIEFEDFYKLIDKSRFIVQSQIKDLQELLDSKMDEYFGGDEK